VDASAVAQARHAPGEATGAALAERLKATWMYGTRHAGQPVTTRMAAVAVWR